MSGLALVTCPLGTCESEDLRSQFASRAFRCGRGFKPLADAQAFETNAKVLGTPRREDFYKDFECHTWNTVRSCSRFCLDRPRLCSQTHNDNPNTWHTVPHDQFRTTRSARQRRQLFDAKRSPISCHRSKWSKEESHTTTRVGLS